MNEHSRILERDKLDIAEPLRSPDAGLRLPAVLPREPYPN